MSSLVKGCLFFQSGFHVFPDVYHRTYCTPQDVRLSILTHPCQGDFYLPCAPPVAALAEKLRPLHSRFWLGGCVGQHEKEIALHPCTIPAPEQAGHTEELSFWPMTTLLW